MISTLDVAWAAGFFEGEASFNPGTKPSEISITANQVQREPLDRLMGALGGRCHLFTPPQKGWSPIWRWYISGSRAAQVMMMVYIFMSPKRRAQIEMALTNWRRAPPERRPLNSPFCLKGHRLAEVGLYKGGRCKRCKRIEGAARYQQRQAELEA